MDSSVQFNRSFMSHSLRPHGLQHARPPCPSPTPGVYSDSCPLSQWCHPTISSYVVPFSACPQSIPALGSFQMSQSLHHVANILEFQIQHQSFQGTLRADLLQDGLVGSTSSPRDSQESSPRPQFKNINFWHSAFFTVQLSYLYMTTGKTIALPRWTFVGKVMSLLFNMLSSLVITFLPRSKCLLISWLQSPSSVILEPKKINSVTVSTVSPSICHEVMGPDAMILVFWMLSFKPTFSLSIFTFIKRLFSSSLSAIKVVSSSYLKLLIFLPAILIPACASSSLAFLMMYSAYKLNKQGDNIQPWRTPFPIWNQSVVPCPVLTVASRPAYRFLKRQVRWSGIPISLEFSTVYYDPHSRKSNKEKM